MADNPTLARIVSAVTEPGATALLGIIFQDLNDDQLRHEWQWTGREPGNPLADLVCAEAERRGIDL